MERECQTAFKLYILQCYSRNGERERGREKRREKERDHLNDFSDFQSKKIPEKGLIDPALVQPTLSRGGARGEQGKYPMGVHNFV